MGAAALSVVAPSKLPQSEEEDSSNPSVALLADSISASSSSSSKLATLIFACLVLVTCISLSFSLAFAFLFFLAPTPNSPVITFSTVTRPLVKLQRPVVILISSDGFRFGYQFKTSTPNIGRLITNGTEAHGGLIPVFPTLTFPNHYSIVTGLYPAFHGIVNNYFTDPRSGDFFTMHSHDPKWWLGEPVWETVVNHGLPAATCFWVGSEVVRNNWTCSPRFCHKYNASISFEDRIDRVLGYFDLPSDEIPVFMTLYFEDPDHQGHQVGPDDPQITAAVARIDHMIGRLMDGLESRGVFEDVTIIFVGDHGMVGTCDRKLIFLDDLAPWINIPPDWVQTYSPVLGIRPPPGHSSSDIVDRMMEGLSSGNVENGKYLKIFLKEDLPRRLHYSVSERIPPIIGLLEEGFKLEHKRSRGKECGGAHGYDNIFSSMKSIFIGHGPQFAAGKKVQSFENIEIYNVITSILGIKGAPNNGSASFPQSILLPSE